MATNNLNPGDLYFENMFNDATRILEGGRAAMFSHGLGQELTSKRRRCLISIKRAASAAPGSARG
jgi:hypothetical protein